MKIFVLTYWKYVLLLLLLYMPIFGHLDSLPIRIWDESRLAVNACEMYQNNNFIVTHYEGQPDMWNTKPPLMIWIQVFWMKLLGVGELAVRLPSAIAALLTCMLLLGFSKKQLGEDWLGILTVLVLVTAPGYIGHHVSRTGDYDSLLVLLTTLYGICYFLYLETKHIRYLYAVFGLLALAVLTKSIAGLLFLPGLFLYALWRREVVAFFTNKHFYIGALGFLMTVAAYYLWREALNPGYLSAVQQNEWGGRYLSALEGHGHGFWLYYDFITQKHFDAWYLLLPCGFLVGFFSKSSIMKRWSVFAFLMITTFFLVISTAKTKLIWYDAPMYPYMASLVGLFLYYIFRYLQTLRWNTEQLTVNVLPYIFVFLMFIAPYRAIFHSTYLPKEKSAEDAAFYEMSYYLQKAAKGQVDVDGRYLLYDDYHAHLLFYKYLLQTKDVTIDFKDWKKLESEDRVFTQQSNIKAYIEQHYDYTLTHTDGKINNYTIHGVKNEDTL